MAKRGRPSKYTDKLANEICARIAAGESLSAICKGEGMPSDATVSGWAVDDVNGFYGKYMRAKQMRCLHYADEIIGISDDGRNDTYINDKGEEKPDVDNIRRSALRVDTRKFLMVKFLPKIFGDKQQVEHSGDVKLSFLDRVKAAKKTDTVEAEQKT